jgi:hypothetical protein
MNLHHRNKAIVGLVLWFFAFVVCMALCVSDGAKTWERDFFSGKGMAAMFWGTVVAQYLFFFWGGPASGSRQRLPEHDLIFWFRSLLSPPVDHSAARVA